ncbi:cytochrome P450 [Streptomyces albospinus]|uniref:Cytochrome P450 n=1 Tax=Streptomyces albospinus TaxID=285515 RepID=A0ABQ2VNI4_9ACTN|nr:cytochrome P450 [Streptomyces albospinus]GGU93814.1 cytochrome P450 [Streptomyces albospinus]
MNNPMESPEFSRDPYPLLATLRTRGPVQRVRTGNGRTTWVVTGWAAARAALADGRLSKNTARYFADRPSTRDLAPAVSSSMLATDPPDHGRLRKLAMSAFTPAAVARLAPRIREIAERLAEALRGPERGPAVAGEVTATGAAAGAAGTAHRVVDLIEGYAVPLPIAVICELLDVPRDDRAAVRRWSDALFAAADPDTVDRASHALSDYMTGLIAARRAAPGDDVLSGLIAARDAGDRLTEPELVSLAVLLVVAGHETTTHLIGNGMLALLRDDALRARLRDDPGLLPAAVEEFLRYDAPITLATFRYATEPFDLGGARIEAGDVVLVSPGAANRDPARFPAPDTVRLDRPAGHLSFGHGPHHCLGAALARMEGRIAFEVLLTRFPGMRAAEDAASGRGDPPTWRRTRLMRGLVRLPVVLESPARGPGSTPQSQP